jgi:hypothetical protein
MTDQTMSSRPAYLRELSKIFNHSHPEVSVFSADQFPADLMEVFVAMVTDSRPIKELETLLAGDFNATLSDHMACLSGQPFVAGLVALLGSKDHYTAALSYIKTHSEEYLCLSHGLFNAVLLTVNSLPLVADLHKLPNYCRKEDGTLRSGGDLRGLIMATEDCFVLVLSAISNRDSEALLVLAECMPSEQVFGILKDQMKQCPGIGLEEEFGHFFEQQTHVVFLALMKGLMASTSSSRADFEAAFWPGASSVALDRFVSEAVGEFMSLNPQMAFLLEVFRERGVDLYPGLVLSEKGFAHYLDAVTAPPDLSTRHGFIMDVIAKRAKIQGGFREDDMSALLRDIPVETIKSHPDADMLFQDLYRGTQDRSILKHIKNTKFKGHALEESLGM